MMGGRSGNEKDDLFAFPSPPAPARASLLKIINEAMRDNWGRGSVLTSSEVHFVSLADNFTLLFSKLLKLPSVASRNGPQVRLPQLKVVNRELKHARF